MTASPWRSTAALSAAAKFSGVDKSVRSKQPSSSPGVTGISPPEELAGGDDSGDDGKDASEEASLSSSTDPSGTDAAEELSLIHI